MAGGEGARPRQAADPLYNIKAVVQRTGVPADTMRAWERRYGVPRPRRTGTGRRLYSERDIEAIRWLRDRTAAGVTISQAIEQLRSIGDEPLVVTVPERDPGPRHFGALTQELLDALLAFDRQTADGVIEEAFTLYSVEDVCLRLLSPVLVEIGERWQRREATVAQEHFASHVIQRRLTGLLHAYNPTVARGLIVAACAPDELHELGLQILAVFLVRRGWRVVYLGANVPIVDLLQTIARLAPDLVCLSAMNLRTTQTLREAAEAVAHLPEPRPPVAFGGAHFNAEPALRERVPGHYLGADAEQAAEQVERLLA